MKRTIIGSVFMLSGVIIDMSIIIAAVFYAQTITSWSGSRFWYAIFGERQYGQEVVQSMSLGFPFLVGITLTILGLIILLKEYFNKNN